MASLSFYNLIPGRMESKKLINISCFDDVKIAKRQILCEIGSENWALALIAAKLKLIDADEGQIAGECNIGEEEIEELLQERIEEILIDENLLLHKDAESIKTLLGLVATRLGVNIYCNDEKLDFANSELNLLPVENFDGLVAYAALRQKNDIYTPAAFASFARLKDGDMAIIKAKDKSAKVRVNVKDELKGTIALVPRELFDGFAFAKCSLEKAD